MRHHVARVAAIAAFLVVSQHGTAAVAEPPPDSEVVQTIGNRTFYADGTVEVDVPVGTMSLSQCDSGQFCVWSQANYLGSFRYKTGTGTKTLGGTVGSFWNNRSSVARLYNNSSSSSTCYENGVKKASVTASYSSAQKVSLSSATGC